MKASGSPCPLDQMFGSGVVEIGWPTEQWPIKLQTKGRTTVLAAEKVKYINYIQQILSFRYVWALLEDNTH